MGEWREMLERGRNLLWVEGAGVSFQPVWQRRGIRAPVWHLRTTFPSLPALPPPYYRYTSPTTFAGGLFFSHLFLVSLCVLSLSLPPALFWWTCSGNFPTTAAAPTASAVRHTTAPSFEKNDLVKVEGKGAAASLGRRNAKVLSNGPDSDCEVHIQFLDNGMQDWVKANWVTESNRQKQAHR
jgi:hypothetical protein